MFNELLDFAVNPPFVVFILAVLYVSAVAGSVMNVVVYRLPRMLFPEEFNLSAGHKESLNRGSRCPHCDSKIRLRHNIPIFGWIILKGGCFDCKAPISVRYPIVELVVTLGSVLIAWHFGQTWMTAAMIGVFWVLVACALIDWDTYFLPDALTQPLLWSGLLFALYAPSASLTIEEAMAGAIFGYLFPWTINRYFRWRTGVDGIAAGDFKLLAALGAWFGVMALPIVVIIAVTFQLVCKAAMPAKGIESEVDGIAAGAMPLGPGLALGGAAMIFLASPLQKWLLASGLVL